MGVRYGLGGVPETNRPPDSIVLDSIRKLETSLRTFVARWTDQTLKLLPA